MENYKNGRKAPSVILSVLMRPVEMHANRLLGSAKPRQC